MIDSNNSNNKQDNINIIDVVSFFWNNKIKIITTTVIFVIIAIIYSFLIPTTYSTQTLLTINHKDQNNILFSLTGFDIINNDIDPFDYIDIAIQDKFFLNDILNRKWKINNDSIYLDQIWKLKVDDSNPGLKQQYDMIKLQQIRKNRYIEIIKDNNKSIITIVVNAPYPELAYDINVYVINKLDNYIRQISQCLAIEEKLIIGNRISEIKKDLEKSENELVFFKERNVSNESPNMMLEEIRLTRKTTMKKELFIQLQKQYELLNIKEKEDQTLLQIIKSPEVPIYRTAPKRKNIAIFGFILGNLSGIGISLILLLANKDNNSFKPIL